MIQSQVAAMNRSQRSRMLFNFLLLANFFQYMEAGALPALLLSIANSFGLNSAQQGFLGGVVYLSLGTGGPFAGYLLRKFDHKTVIVCAVAANMFFTFLWAMTPVGQVYSAYMFILMRFMMGLCQCIVCVFLPLWTNENAPRKNRTTWMSYLQASVPCGIMVGYIIASMCVYVSQHAETCWGLLCWRWPFLIEMSLLCPMYVCLYFVPANDLSVRISHYSPKKKANASNDVASFSNAESVANNNRRSGDMEEQKAMQLDSSSQSISEMIHHSTSAKGRSGFIERSSTQRWMNIQTLDEVEEKKHRMSWRRSSLSASMYDPMSTRDIIKRSHDDIALLDPADLTGFRWTGSSQAPSPYDQQPATSASTLLPRQTISPDTFNGSPAVGNHNTDAYSMGGGTLDEGTMRDGGKLSKPATPTNDHPKTQLVLHKSPSFDSISRVSHANAVSFAPFLHHEQNQVHTEPEGVTIDSTVKRTSTGSNVPVYYEPLKYESLKEVKRKSLSDDMTQHIHFFHPSTPNTSIKPSRGEVGTSRRPRAQSFELHTLHSMAGSPGTHTLRKTRHSDTYLAPTEHTPLLRSEVGTPQNNSRQSPADKVAPSMFLWLSSWFGRKEASSEETSVNRVLYQHDSFRGREKHFKTLEMNIAIDPESDSQSGSDSEDEWMEYSPLKQRSFPFPETPLQPEATVPTPPSPGGMSGYPTSSNVSHNLSGRVLDTLMYCMRCCKRERKHHHGQKKSWWKSVKALLCLPVYRNLLGAMSALYFTVTGVQYWGTKYLLISLHAPLLLVNVLFVLCAATGPVLGVFFGGYIIDVFGGYKGYKKRVSALKLVCTLGLVGCVSTLPITFLDNIYLVVLCLWLVLFFGGSSLPACAGILVSVVPRHHRPTSASLSLVVFNMCGYCLSLILSGLLMQVLESHSDVCDAVCAMTWGFRLILFWSFFSFFFLLSAYLSARKYLQEREMREHQYEMNRV